MTFRCDRSTLKHYDFTPEGFMRVIFPAAREGWHTYWNADGTKRREYVSTETLHKSADSFKLKPITQGHPPVRVTPENARTYQVGMTGNTAIIDNGFLWLTGVVTDQGAIDAIKSGKTKEVSLGYDTRLEPKEDGFEQVERVGNHAAAVEKGRHGSEVSFRIDGEDDFSFNVDAIDSPIPQQLINHHEEKNDAREETKTVQILIGKRIFNIDGADASEVATEIANLQTKHDEVEVKATKLDAEIGALKGEVSKLEGKLAAAETTLAEKNDRADDDVIEAEIQARSDAWDEVEPWLKSEDPKFKRDGRLDQAGIRKLYISKRAPNINLDGKSEDYIDGVYEMLAPNLEDIKPRNDVDDLLNDIQRGRVDMKDNGKDDKKLMNRRKARALPGMEVAK